MRKVIFFLVLIVLVSCERSNDITYSLPYEGVKKVIYGFITIGEKTRVEIFNTSPTLENKPDFIPEANFQVIIFENDKAIDTLNKENNHYFSESVFFPEKAYHISTFDGKNRLNSEKVVIPKKVSIKKCNFIPNQDFSFILLNLEFEDNPLTNDFYVFKTEKYINGKIKQEGALNSNAKFAFNDILLDKDIENNTYQKEIESKVVVYGNNGERQEKIIDSVKITILHLSEDFYKFQKSLNENNTELGSLGAYSKPLWTNIPNAYGVVGGLSYSHYTLKVK
jgi:hypothetical protein